MSIKSLSAETVKLIKSTQVVSNVWSVVKELVENALDANATNVEVYLVENGLSVIKVSDNGFGISKEDAAYIGLPSHTSKLANFKDLESITSYGFRGVALNSICALGEVTVTTKTDSDQVATIYTLDHDGKIDKTAESHGNRGTTVQVKDLCKGLPVRRKILSESKAIKKDVKNVETLIKDFCICNPGVRFVLQINGKMTFTKPIVKDLKEALIHVAGRANVMKLHGFNHSIGGIEVELLVPKKDATNLSDIFKSGQSYIFVNKRPVKHKAIEQTILKKITEYFSSDHPNAKKSLFVVNISVNPADVDVNLEPNKDKVLLHNHEKVEIVLDEILSNYYGLEVLERSNSDKENAETPNHSLNPFDETFNPDSSQDSSLMNNVNDPGQKVKETKRSHDNEQVRIKRVVKTPVLSDPDSDEDVGKAQKKIPDLFNTMVENSRLDNENDRQPVEETLSQLPVVNLGEDFDLSDLQKQRASISLGVDKKDQNTSETMSKDDTVEIGSDAWSRGRIIGGGGVDVLPVNYVDLDCKNGSVVTNRSPKSAFGIFFSDERSQIMRENPDAKETEVAKQLTKKWNDLSSEERGYYRDQAMKQQEALTPRSQKRSLQNDDQENNRRKIVKYLTTEKHENTDKQTLIAKRTILPWNVTLQDVKHSFKNASSPKRKPKDLEFTVVVIGRAPDNDNFWFVNYDNSNWIINVPALLKESTHENILLCQVTATLLKQLLNERLSKSFEIDPTVMHHIHDE